MTSYQPSEAFKEEAEIQEKKYLSLIEQFSSNKLQTWAKLAKEELYWHKDFSKTFEKKDYPFFSWFEDGQTNISYNCLDIHLKDKADKTAVIFEGEPGDKISLTYQELHTQVCKTANYFKSIGFKKGDVVCIYMPLCPEAIISMQACMRIGLIHNVVFAGFSAQALRERIEDSQAKLIITANGLNRKGKVIDLLKLVREASEDLTCVEKILVHKRIAIETQLSNKEVFWQETIPEQANDCQPVWLDAEDPSFILYTSGSTGKPKGIRHSTAGYILWAKLTSKWVFDLKDSDVYWCTADIGWITGHSYVAYGPLANGATIFIYEGAPNYPDENRFWNLIEDYGITIFYTAPTAIRAFMQWQPKGISYKLESLRLLGTVGEPINPAAWTWFYEHVGKSRCPIVDTWWQTETGGIMITTLPGIHDMKPGTAGLALPGIEAKVNEEGLLYIANPHPGLARTIHNDDKRYLDTYWSRIDGAYTAGDAASKDQDSYITIAGRIDDVINVSGHRLGTAEIESALVAHDSVSEAAVVAIPHDLKGEGIIAFTVTSADCCAEDLSEQIVKEIGALARPEKIIICRGLPKTRSGKIMRRLLKDIAKGKKPDGDISTLEDITILDELYSSCIALN